MTTLNPGDTTTSRILSVTVTLDRALEPGEVVKLFRNDQQSGADMTSPGISTTIEDPIVSNDGSDPVLNHKAVFYPTGGGAPVESAVFPVTFDDEIRCAIDGVYNPNPVLTVGLVEVDAPGGTGGDGSSPEEAILITALPFEATLGSISSGAVIWYKMNLAENLWVFTTETSPGPETYDTYLALFDSDGTYMAQNEDIGGSDYRSRITYETLAGTYYLAVSTYPGSASSGFNVNPGDTNVPAGTILQIYLD